MHVYIEASSLGCWIVSHPDVSDHRISHSSIDLAAYCDEYSDYCRRECFSPCLIDANRVLGLNVIVIVDHGRNRIPDPEYIIFFAGPHCQFLVMIP